MKYLSLALIVVSVSAVPIVMLLVTANKDIDADFSGWATAGVLIVLISALAMFP